MAKIEVDEVELLENRKLREVVSKMMAIPEARKRVLEGRKIAFPEESIPEIDAKNEAVEVAKKGEQIALDTKKQLEDYLAAQEADKAKQTFASAWEGQKAKLRAQGYTDDGIAKIEEHAQKEGIPNLRAAAADWEKLNPPATPAAPNGIGTWDFFQPSDREGDEIKKLVETRGDDDMALRKLINAGLDEARQGSGRR